MAALSDTLSPNLLTPPLPLHSCGNPGLVLPQGKRWSHPGRFQVPMLPMYGKKYQRRETDIAEKEGVDMYLSHVSARCMHTTAVHKY